LQVNFAVHQPSFNLVFAKFVNALTVPSAPRLCQKGI